MARRNQELNSDECVSLRDAIVGLLSSSDFNGIPNECSVSLRHKAWEHCHKAFISKRGKTLDDHDLDYLSLNLATYLANWGMYRNRSLMNCDYKIHYDAIRKMMDVRYSLLWDYEPSVTNQQKASDLLFSENGLVGELSNIYNPYNLGSDTFITKILLGVFGCTPAYDTNFKTAYASLKNNCFNEGQSVKFDEESFKEVCLSVQDVRTILDFPLCEVWHPAMKCFDFIVWSFGSKLINLEIDTNNNGSSFEELATQALQNTINSWRDPSQIDDDSQDEEEASL